MATVPSFKEGASPRPGERTAPRAERRLQLINATIESIAERGFSDTTLASVTKRAGLSHGTINFHFKSKDLLFIETLEYLAQEHDSHWRAALAAAGPTAEAQLIALIDTDFAPSICDPKKLAVWFAFWGEAKARPAYLEVNDRYDRDRLDAFALLCRRLKDEGGYDDVDPEVVAKGVEAFVDGLWLNLLLYPDRFKREEARQDCVSFLVGIFPRHFSAFKSAARGATVEDDL